MGTIVGDLGKLENFVWIVSAYMAVEIAGTIIFGKLSGTDQSIPGLNS